MNNFTHFVLERRSNRTVTHTTEYLDGRLYLVSSTYENGILVSKLYSLADTANAKIHEQLKFTALAINKLQIDSDWNPLKNYGDALSVLNKINGTLKLSWCATVYVDHGQYRLAFSESFVNGQDDAVCKAVVKAATFLGKEKMRGLK